MPTPLAMESFRSELEKIAAKVQLHLVPDEFLRSIGTNLPHLTRRVVGRTHLQGRKWTKHPRGALAQLERELQMITPGRKTLPRTYEFPTPRRGQEIMLPVGTPEGELSGRFMLTPGRRGGHDIDTFFHDEMGLTKANLLDVLQMRARRGDGGAQKVLEQLENVTGDFGARWARETTPMSEEDFKAYLKKRQDWWRSKGDKKPAWTAKARAVLKDLGLST